MACIRKHKKFKKENTSTLAGISTLFLTKFDLVLYSFGSKILKMIEVIYTLIRVLILFVLREAPSNHKRQAFDHVLLKFYFKFILNFFSITLNEIAKIVFFILVCIKRAHTVLLTENLGHVGSNRWSLTLEAGRDIFECHSVMSKLLIVRRRDVHAGYRCAHFNKH